MQSIFCSFSIALSLSAPTKYGSNSTNILCITCDCIELEIYSSYISICYSENNQTSRIIHKATQNYVFYLLQIEKIFLFCAIYYRIELNRIHAQLVLTYDWCFFHLLFLFYIFGWLTVQCMCGVINIKLLCRFGWFVLDCQKY